MEGLPGGYPERGVARGGISHEWASSPEYIDGREHWGGGPGCCVIEGNQRIPMIATPGGPLIN